MDQEVLFKLQIELYLDTEELAKSLSKYGERINDKCLTLIEEMGRVISFAKEKLITSPVYKWLVMEDGKLVFTVTTDHISVEQKNGIITITYDNFRRLFHLQAKVERDEILSIGFNPVIKIDDEIDTIYWISKDKCFCLSNIADDWYQRQKSTTIVSTK